ncbi:hypothetical protein [Mesorhizobium retamae]|nr:hypothetical protein [Mesorhizobium sp. IRAMC:0171]
MAVGIDARISDTGLTETLPPSEALDQKALKMWSKAWNRAKGLE